MYVFISKNLTVLILIVLFRHH